MVMAGHSRDDMPPAETEADLTAHANEPLLKEDADVFMAIPDLPTEFPDTSNKAKKGVGSDAAARTWATLVAKGERYGGAYVVLLPSSSTHALPQLAMANRTGLSYLPPVAKSVTQSVGPGDGDRCRQLADKEWSTQSTGAGIVGTSSGQGVSPLQQSVCQYSPEQCSNA